ncbi:unnamed protein product [Phaedon cochleariae]|uniref:Peptidase S1 domain-containing protein n=1 Tax=Phaedon cochleariae TaxID=80249 RepID=A0A9P0DPM9_PHACE|nr:unnamed protein product [Phaedon cochleariae]
MAIIGFGSEDDIQWQCGASLISFEFVLTAAHCLYSLVNGPARYVRVGDLDISTETDRAEFQQFSVKRGIPHPDYLAPSRYHDIALIELDRQAIKTEFVAPACLDTVRFHEEEQMIATGWGKTSFAGDISSHLLKINLDLVPNDECRKFFRNTPKEFLDHGIDDEMQICAGGGPLQDTCQGDSGGPLQVLGDNQVYTITGVTSFGKACGISKSPGIYTRIFNYLTWIEDTVWPIDQRDKPIDL